MIGLSILTRSYIVILVKVWKYLTASLSWQPGESNIQTRCSEVLSAVRDEQFARSKGIDNTGKVTMRTFTARLSALVSQRRGKGHESISFLDAVEELKTHSNQNRMPQFKMLFASTCAIRVSLLSPSSTLVHD